jgi:hypothetical protein
MVQMMGRNNTDLGFVQRERGYGASFTGLWSRCQLPKQVTRHRDWNSLCDRRQYTPYYHGLSERLERTLEMLLESQREPSGRRKAMLEEVGLACMRSVRFLFHFSLLYTGHRSIALALPEHSCPVLIRRLPSSPRPHCVSLSPHSLRAENILTSAQASFASRSRDSCPPYSRCTRVYARCGISQGGIDTYGCRPSYAYHRNITKTRRISLRQYAETSKLVP